MSGCKGVLVRVEEVGNVGRPVLPEGRRRRRRCFGTTPTHCCVVVMREAYRSMWSWTCCRSWTLGKKGRSDRGLVQTQGLQRLSKEEMDDLDLAQNVGNAGEITLAVTDRDVPNNYMCLATDPPSPC